MFHSVLLNKCLFLLASTERDHTVRIPQVESVDFVRVAPKVLL
jgi:hypothetical protein